MQVACPSYFYRMSSHHIVRDEQEPALLVLDPHAISRSLLNGLLEWSPTVIVSQKVFRIFSDWGIKVDFVVLKEGEKVDVSEMNDLSDLILAQSEQTLVEKTLQFLMTKGHKAVNVVGNPENALIFYGPITSKLDVVLFDAGIKLLHIKSGLFKKWYNAHTSIYIVPITNTSYFSTTGCINDLNNELVTAEMCMVSEANGIVQIRSNYSPFLVGESC